MTKPNARAQTTAQKNYHRNLRDSELIENWSQVAERIISHQRWLWERALSRSLNEKEEEELEELKSLIRGRYVLPSGRTLWHAGTELARARESSMFNSAFTNVETVYDLVDLFWLILQGCAIGFKPVTGTLNGFRRPLQEIKVIRSTRTSKGLETNVEKYDPETGTWVIKVGDSAAAWAKALGKLLAGKFPAKVLVLDFSEIRPAGSRLRGYGWISAGDEAIASAFKKIAKILSDRADQLLSRMDILDIINLIGTLVHSKEVSQLALFDYDDPEWEDFALAKKEWWLKGNDHRQQSENVLLFHRKPDREELESLFKLMVEMGGSEPGFINGKEAERRAPWFKGMNPGLQTLLGNKSFCNQVEVNLSSFRGDKMGLERALYLAGRMSYRQSMVNLRDEILQEAWHLNNDFLHLCGVGLTGVRSRSDLTAYDYKRMKNITVSAAYSMAGELNSPLPKNVTFVKPSLTLSAIMGTEAWGEVAPGIELPLGKYLFNYVAYPKDEPIVHRLKQSGYHVQEKPYEPETVLIRFPVKYDYLPFQRVKVTRKTGRVEEIEVNQETAVQQLNYYHSVQSTWSEQNVSTTIHYEPSEIPQIIDWILENWDCYIGVNFVNKVDPTKNADDLGVPYLKEEVVTKEAFDAYRQRLRPVDYEGIEAPLEQEMLV